MKKHAHERWMAHPTLHRTLVSTLGRVRRGREWETNPFQFNRDGRPYFEVNRRKIYVHHVVLETFVGPRPEGMYALHHDDDPANCTLANLYWGTLKDNIADRNRNRPGWAVTKPKLTEQDVVEIRTFAGTVSTTELARRYGVAHSTMRKVVKGETWKGVG
jgi:hypothetical protein